MVELVRWVEPGLDLGDSESVKFLSSEVVCVVSLYNVPNVEGSLGSVATTHVNVVKPPEKCEPLIMTIDLFVIADQITSKWHLFFLFL